VISRVNRTAARNYKGLWFKPRVSVLFLPEIEGLILHLICFFGGNNIYVAEFLFGANFFRKSVHFFNSAAESIAIQTQLE
jgi:hypothetical protein